jgi:hypothetical protein
VYVKRPQPSLRQGDSARRILAQIDDSVGFIRKYYRFASQADQALALGQFARGREFYARLAATG